MQRRARLRRWSVVVVMAAAVLVTVALARTFTDGGSGDALIDERVGAYGGVGVGDSSVEVRRVFGEPSEDAQGFSPAGESPAEVGVPQQLPGPGALLKYDDVAFLVGQKGVYAFIVSEDGARTRRGVAIGSDLEHARNAYRLDCIDVAGGESLFGGQEFYPSCRATLEDSLRMWFGRDPVRSITILSMPLAP